MKNKNSRSLRALFPLSPLYPFAAILPAFLTLGAVFAILLFIDTQGLSPVLDNESLRVFRFLEGAVLLAVLSILILRLIMSSVEHWSQRYSLVGGDRLQISKGLAKRNTAVFPLQKVSEFCVTRGPIDYLLGAATLEVIVPSARLSESSRIEGLGNNTASRLQRFLTDVAESKRHVAPLSMSQHSTQSPDFEELMSLAS